MQVMRAVLRWHGVIIPNNPLGRPEPLHEGDAQARVHL
jgi:hypothetical protein